MSPKRISPPAQVRFDDQLRARVNDWRRQQDKIPTLAEAVRALVRMGLGAADVPEPKRKERAA
ncbi:hypothetical protein [Bradyrhizobium sp. Ash2021]|uniref:hypothetical protein n=1 Tax=Bradyrhizobium sp. Ash2021 TaxID=2954771 RepID=UPI00281670FE|nr:hypothetical protein [Bradyrhizobium sp. Ash2021]WMT78825.1 hypothetical protein NL528_21865 [Bradyrhizobium sp. Ash2021]